MTDYQKNEGRFSLLYLKFPNNSILLVWFWFYFTAMNVKRFYKVLETIEHFNLLQLGAIHL